MMTCNLPALTGAVQRNCDISDARYAGDYGLCTFLLKMREYYRWENELPFSRTLAKNDVGEWLQSRETGWTALEEEAFQPLPLAGGDCEPLAAAQANRELLPLGLVYGAGYGRFHKPVFFLGRLLRVESRGCHTLIVSSCEYARELAAPPAMLQGRTIYLRQEAVRRYLWEKIEESQWRRHGGAMTRALAGLDFIGDTEAALDRLAGNEMESMILHELGEAMAGDLLGDAWGEMMVALARTPAEPLARAVRDLIADCLSTLPVLLARANQPALHFYFATFDAPRRQLFPEAMAAYEHYARYADLGRLRQLVEEGGDRWLDCARGLLSLDPAARPAALDRLLAPSARPVS